MKTIEVSTNIEELNEKAKELDLLVKEINDFEFKGVFKKEGSVKEYSTNLDEINKKISRLRKLVNQINNFKVEIKHKTNKKSTR